MLLRNERQSFAAELKDGTVIFFEARRFTIQDGRLMFWDGLRLVGAVEQGEWLRVQAGLGREDLE